VEVNRFSNTTYTVQRPSGSDSINYARVENPSGCGDTWRQRCEHICKVTVHAPSNGDLEIRQVPTDTTPKVRVYVTPGTNLNKLRVCHHWPSCPSLDVDVDGFTSPEFKSWTEGAHTSLIVRFGIRCCTTDLALVKAEFL